MKLIVDTREKEKSGALSFVSIDGVEIVREYLNVGDYTARHIDGTMDDTVVERKEKGDLFSSFTSNYEAERAKIIRAKTQNLKYVLAIESSLFDVRKGHTYWNGEEYVESKKDGLSMIKQLMTITRKYGVDVHFFNGRQEMAFWILHYFYARHRALS